MSYKNPKFLGALNFVSKYFAFNLLFFFTLTTVFLQSIQARPMSAATVVQQEQIERDLAKKIIALLQPADLVAADRADQIVDKVVKQGNFQLSEEQRNVLIEKVVAALLEKESIESIVFQLIEELENVQHTDKDQIEDTQKTVIACSPLFGVMGNVEFDDFNNLNADQRALLIADIDAYSVTPQFFADLFRFQLLDDNFGCITDFNFDTHRSDKNVRVVSTPEFIGLKYKGFGVGTDLKSVIELGKYAWYKVVVEPRLNKQAIVWVDKYALFTAHQFENKMLSSCGLQGISPSEIYGLHKQGYSALELKAYHQYKLYQFPEYIKFIKQFYNYEDFIRKLQDQLASDSEASYKASRLPGFFEKSFVKVVDGLVLDLDEKQKALVENRFKAKSQELQNAEHAELQELNDFYDEFAQAHGISGDLEHIQRRKDAIEHIIAGNDMAYENEYQVSSQAQTLLEKHNFSADNYIFLTGDELQHAIHKEFVNHLNKCATSSEVVPGLVEFIDAGMAYNKAGRVAEAMAISDYCWVAVEWMQNAGKFAAKSGMNLANYVYKNPIEAGTAVGKGALKGGKNIYHYVKDNPVEATLVIGGGAVGGAPVILTYYGCKLTHYLTGIGYDYYSADIAQRTLQWDTLLNQIDTTQEAIATYWDEASTADIIEDSVAFGTELALMRATDKLIGATGKLLTSARPKIVEYLKRVPQPKPIVLPQPIAAGIGQVSTEARPFEHLVHFMEKMGEKQSRSMKFVDKKWTRLYQGVPKGVKGLIKKYRLPTKGKIRYVPPKWVKVSTDLPKDRATKGFIDRFGNIWTRGKSRTVGQQIEWDVQLSKKGRSQLGWMTRDGSHLNVSLDGRVTHK